MLLLRQVLQFLHVHFSPEREATGAQHFGDLLRQHRCEAGPQQQLADYSGLSSSLVRKLEQSDAPPTRKSLLSLCNVQELKLVPPEVTTLPTNREFSNPLAPNWYMSPGFDSVTMMAELHQQLNGSGGTVEQTYVYLDPKSALDWITLANSPSYVAAARELPVQRRGEDPTRSCWRRWFGCDCTRARGRQRAKSGWSSRFTVSATHATSGSIC